MFARVRQCTTEQRGNPRRSAADRCDTCRVDHETPAPFGLMLRRPGDVADPDADWPDPHEYEGIYLAPDFTARHLWYDTGAGSDPRTDNDDWSLSLPHQCGEWGIWDGPREQVLDAARRFRAELDQAITAMEAASD